MKPPNPCLLGCPVPCGRGGCHCYKDVVRPYLWPIVDNKERNLTRTPATLENEEGFDHIHHRSCWIAHGDINGIDNWSEEKAMATRYIKHLRKLFLTLFLEKSGLRITGQTKKRKKFLKKKEL